MSKLINENPLMVLPSLAAKLGIERAIILQQIHFLCNQPHSGTVIDGKRYVYNTYADWRRQYFPFWSAKTIQRHILILEKEGYLQSVQPGVKDGVAVKYYRVNETHPELSSPRLTGETTPIQHIRRTPSNTLDHLYKGTKTSTKTSTDIEKRATALPKDFAVTEEMAAWHRKNFPHANLAAETDKFRDHHLAKGSKFKDWTAAWRTWMRNADRWSVKPEVKIVKPSGPVNWAEVYAK